MLFDLLKTEPLRSAQDLKTATVRQDTEVTDGLCVEDPTQDIIGGVHHSQTHAERYEFVQNRTYATGREGPPMP